MFTQLRAVFYAGLFVLLWTWVATSVRPLDSRLTFSIPASLGPIGFAVAGLGAVLAASCIAVFSTRGRGTPAPFDAPREFVATGPYRYVRNPMYIGASGVMIGCGLIVRSPSIVILTGGFLLLTHLFVLFYEEPALEKRFGSSYLDYKQSVSRWIPHRPRARTRSE